MEPQTEVERYFHCRIAVIEMKPGESKEGAWLRHMAGHPEDSYANIKIFNRNRKTGRHLKEHRAEEFCRDQLRQNSSPIISNYSQET